MGIVSSWLAKLTDLVNLGKLMTDGGPGTVLALALMLGIATYRGVPLLPSTYGGEEDEVAAQPSGQQVGAATGQPSGQAAGAAAEQRSPALKTLDGQIRAKREEIVAQTKKNGEVESKLVTLQAALRSPALKALDLQIRAKREGIVAQTKEKGEVESELVTLQAALLRNQDLIDTFTKAQADRAGKDYPFIRAVEQGIEDLNRQRTKLCGSPRPNCAAQAELEAKKAGLAKDIEAAQAQLDRFLARRADLEKKTVDTLEDLLGSILSHLVGLALVGYVLGTMLSPINRALLQSNPTTWGEVLRLKLRLRSPKLMKQQDGTGKKARKRLNKIRHKKPELTLVDKKNAKFWVGKGVISNEEYNGFVTDYYRWAEVSINMIIPTIVLGVSVSYWLLTNWCHSNPKPFPGVLLIGILLTVSLAEIFVNRHLFWVARERHEDYKRQLHDFITGRLKHLEEQAQQAAAARQVQTVLSDQVKELIKTIQDHFPNFSWPKKEPGQS